MDDKKIQKELKIIEYAGVILAVLNVALIVRQYSLRNKIKS
jgi:hypothetical protein